MYYQLDENFLAHFGVPGMRWGHRKAQSSSGTLSKRKQKKLKKAEVKAALKKNKQDYKKAKRRANERFEKDTEEYRRAYDKLNRKFDRDEHKATKKYDQIDEISNAVGLGSITQYNRQRTSNAISAKRQIAQEALDTKYDDMINSAYDKRSKSIRKAKSIYKDNKNRLVSSLKS